ncbi:hypothetical protein D9756_011109 [Leucocoprinus leucothites]|uniref:Uncharacterized protein n=1 Tax=Leucocoprinus leucothites TaxID=201217 RepID=A0A8H5CTR0_9AGAR|nr:hypothetical protein D9756_011109 [Leucoagaricus leucothites]
MAMRPPGNLSPSGTPGTVFIRPGGLKLLEHACHSHTIYPQRSLNFIPLLDVSQVPNMEQLLFEQFILI